MGGKEPYRNSDATCQVKSLIDAKDSKRIRATPLHHAFKTIDKRMGSGQNKPGQCNRFSRKHANRKGEHAEGVQRAMDDQKLDASPFSLRDPIRLRIEIARHMPRDKQQDGVSERHKNRLAMHAKATIALRS
jgi:hypothetical protein